MREIDQVRITLLRLVSGAVQLPEEIINEMLKAFLHTRNAAIKVQAITKGWLVRFNPYDYMDDAAANVFSYTPADPGHILGRVGLKPSMYHRNRNTATALSRYTEYQRRRTGNYRVYRRDVGFSYQRPQAVRSGGAYSRTWIDVFNSLPSLAPFRE